MDGVDVTAGEEPLVDIDATEPEVFDRLSVVRERDTDSGGELVDAATEGERVTDDIAVGTDALRDVPVMDGVDAAGVGEPTIDTDGNWLEAITELFDVTGQDVTTEAEPVTDGLGVEEAVVMTVLGQAFRPSRFLMEID